MGIRSLHRYLRKTGFIIVCIVSMLVFYSVIIGNIESVTKSIQEVNNQLTKNHLDISFDESLLNKDVIKLVNELEQNKNIILKYYTRNGFDYNGYYEGIFFNGEFNSGYSLLEGRFFTKEDFYTSKNIAVIGKDILKYTAVENNKRYVFRGLDKYEVIGVMGKKNLSTRYDEYTLYNLNSVLNDKRDLDKSMWWLDSVSISKTGLQKIVSTIGNHSIHITANDENPPNPLAQALTRSQTLISSFVLVILCILLTLVRAVLYWVDSICLEIGVRMSYGATKTIIFLDIMKRYFLVTLISMAVSFVLQILLFQAKFIGLINYQIGLINFFLSILFILLLGLIFIGISIYKINQLDINQLLKESYP